MTEIRMPDEYASNIARCANLEKGNVHGMKSHDCHVFMECVLLIAFGHYQTLYGVPLLN